MTREESIEVIKQDIPCEHDADLIEALEMAIQALSQECVGSTQKSVENALEMRCDDAVSRELEIKKLKEQPAKVYIDKTDYQRGYIDGVNQMVKELKAEQEPCTDAVSREAVLDIIRFEDKWLLDAKGHNADTEIAFSGMKSRIAELPSVTQKSETVTEFADRCRECGAKYDKYRKEAKRWKNKGLKLKSQKSGKWIIDRSVLPYTYTCNICDRNVFEDYDYCPFCGCRMFEPQERGENE